jgi:hypothetical protein
VLTTMEVGSLSRVKNILADFGNISGLECNVEKNNSNAGGFRFTY